MGCNPMMQVKIFTTQSYYKSDARGLFTLSVNGNAAMLLAIWL